MIPGEESEKILKLLASISTKRHAKQIVKRNEEALSKDESYNSYIACPHCKCEPEHQCSDCLWTYAVTKVLGTMTEDLLSCPCIQVSFRAFGALNDKMPDEILIGTDRLSDDSCHEDQEAEEWLKAHVAWGKSEGWETETPPKGYRCEVNGVNGVK